MLDLTALAQLPGAVDQNFEALTRALVSRRFGAAGTLRERRNQPGVEFYLCIHRSCPLGDPGRVFGWSCKWFLLGASNEFSGAQRARIQESIDKAITDVDGLSDFVLCLPQRPAKRDLDWYYSLAGPKGVELHLWAAENFDAELAGCDELRAAFFGELVVTPEGLAGAHERSVAPIKARWVPPLHTVTPVEAALELALLSPPFFEPLEVHANAIAVRVGHLRGGLDEIDDGAVRGEAEAVADDLHAFADQLHAVVGAARDGRPMEVRERLENWRLPATTPRRLRALVLALRKRRLPAALEVSGLGAEIRSAVGWLRRALDLVGAPLIAVVAAAGHGKTHLGAQLSAPADGKTAGVFVQGGRLRDGDTLDELARRIPGLGVDRFEDLLEALDAAGARSGQRLPLVIDGLNEAERPTGWPPLLKQLLPVLDTYPHVLLVLTLRERLAEQAIPDEATRLDLEWQEPQVDELVDKYFAHYLIDGSGAWLPWGLFRNPLFLRMYCEAANGDRIEPVGAEALPTSLVGVFELYRDRVAQRLAEDPVRKPVPADEIRRRLAGLAGELWDHGGRRIPSDGARAILDQGETDWDESLFRRLEEEGVILRDDFDAGYDTVSGVVFDRFAGYLLADALLARIRYGEIEGQLADPALWSRLAGEDAHPLGEDVAVCLVGLVPRRFGGHHLWKSAPESRGTWALAQELNNESELLDEETVDALAELVKSWELPNESFPYGRRHPFDRLWEVCSAPSHRLNALFLDSVLRSLPLPERDRRWTEWVRTRASDQLLEELASQIEYWSNELDRWEGDDLYAFAVAWLQSSTNKAVRDLATKALQRYGRPDPKRLFDLAARMANVDDPYIEERVVAAALGAATTHQMPDPGGPFERALGRWLAVLQDRYLNGGTAPTSHELLRMYVRSTFEFAGALHPDALPPGIEADDLVFATTPPADVMADDDPNAEECSRTFGMDFENYVIGSAIEGRSNYDFDDSGFRRARGEVMARVWNLGWRAELLGDLDRAIADRRARLTGSGASVERYGKKYGWIAYYELVGRLADAGRNAKRWVGGGRNVYPDIDPTFPEEPPAGLVDLPEWAPAAPTDDGEWLRSGPVAVPEDLWSPPELGGLGGPWLLVEGFLEHGRDGRRVFGFFRTLLIDPGEVDAAVALIEGRPYLGNRFLPELTEVHGVFAGEVPWSPRFDVVFDDEEGPYRPALQQEWNDPGIPVDHVAVKLGTSDTGSPTGLQHSYDVPSFGFAARFGLRQLPGTLDLVSLDGDRASVICRAEGQWSGHLLFLRRDLVLDHADASRVVRVAWGERHVEVDWSAVPDWMREVHQAYGHVWRDIQILD